MALRAVVFDVGETLVDETGMWERAADKAGVPRFTLMGILGGLEAGMVAVHVRRGPWGHLHEPSAGSLRVRSLAEVPGALGV